jgi:aminotransferase
MHQPSAGDARTARDPRIGQRTLPGPVFPVNRRVAALAGSELGGVFDRLAGSTQVISLGIGEPDFPTPQPIRDAAIRALLEGRTTYTASNGLPELRQEIADDLWRRRGVRYDADREVIVTVGVSEALDLALRATLNDGDEVILPDPAYVAYAPSIMLAGGVPVPIPTYLEDEFRLIPARVAAAVTERTRGLLLGFPSNPTGAVLQPSDLNGLAHIAEEHNLIVYSDEIYERLVYETQQLSISQVAGMRERTLYLGGFSKSYAMTGWRVGFVCGPHGALAQLTKIHRWAVMCAPTLSQYGALEALRHGETALEQMRQTYDARRRFMVGRLNSLGLTCFEPRGAFYCFPNIAETGLGDVEFAMGLLERQRVVVAPGSAFGEQGRDHIRICYAASLERLEEACLRIERFLSGL